MANKFARWVFTLNNPEGYIPSDHVNNDVAYLVWQTERGADGTPHLQGYIRFRIRKTMQTVKNQFECDAMHLEPARSNEQQCRDYSTKEDTRIEGSAGEYGTFKPDEGKQGRRSDLEAIADKCRRGVPLQQIAGEHAGDFIRYHAGIAQLHQQIAPLPPPQRDVTVWVLWGATGTGKTHRVLTAYPEAYSVLGRGRDPWGQYRGQAVLLLDEFDCRNWTVQEMNAILDKWRHRLDCRYRDSYAAWTLIFICANSDPMGWWHDAPPLLLESIRRRLRTSCRQVRRQGTIEDAIAQPPEPDFTPVDLDQAGPAPQAD